MGTSSTQSAQKPAVSQSLFPLPQEQPIAQQDIPVTANQPQELLAEEPANNRDIARLDDVSEGNSTVRKPAELREAVTREPENSADDDTDITLSDNVIANVSDEDKKTYEMELEHYNQRLRQLKALKDVQGQAKVLNEIANTERLMQKYETAIFHADQSVQLWKQLGEDDGTAAAYLTLGTVYREAGNTRKAETALSTGLSLAQGDNLKERRGLLLGEISKVYEAQGNKRLAYEKINAAVVLLRQTDSPMLRMWEEELKRLELSMK